ncbi:MAG: DUF5652 family protein [Nanoarchaeota archaeon]
MNPLLSDYQFLANIPPILLAIVLIWSLIWKGLALWKASKRDSKGWFVAILIINTVGILEILYFFLFSKIDLDEKNSKSKVKKRK